MSGGTKGVCAEPPNAQSCPWLMFSHGRSNNIQTFYSIADNRHIKRMLPHLSRTSIIHAAIDGWAVITVEEKSEKDGDSYSCFLLHLTSMEKIILPKLKDIENLECFISSSPLKANCIVIFISRILEDGRYRGSRIKLWRPNQNLWVDVVTKNLKDLITCDGKIYGMNGRYFVTVDIHDDDIELINKIEMPNFDGSIMFHQYLIESYGDVFLVRKLMSVFVENRGHAILVYKLVNDKKTTKKEWMRLTDIGDRVFFIHTLNNFSCSATQAGLEGNSIYFAGFGKDTHIYRYSLKKKWVYRDLPCPDVVNKIRQICWLMIN